MGARSPNKLSAGERELSARTFYPGLIDPMRYLGRLQFRILCCTGLF